MNKTEKIGGKAKTAEAIAASTTNTNIKKKMEQAGFYVYKTPQDVLRNCKVLYIVHYHQCSLNKAHKSFPSEQCIEFADPNPIVARQQAFSFARSINTFPENQPIEFVEGSSKKIEGSNLMNTTFRWCTIDCIEYGTINRLLVYSESITEPTPAFLEEMSNELELYKRLGAANDIPTTKFQDENGEVYEAIAEGNNFNESYHIN